MMRNTWIASLGLIPVTFFQAMRAGVLPTHQNSNLQYVNDADIIDVRTVNYLQMCCCNDMKEYY
jgi:hypothetical protein